MAYTTIDDPAQYFNTVLYTGNGSTQSITGVGFQPDWVWNKNRSSARNHYATDSVRGAQKTLRQNSTDGESTQSGGVTAFNSDGFSVGSDNVVNESGDSLVAWNWLAGGSASSNSDGSITTSVSVNTTAGFSIVSYTGTGSLATVGHGLGVAPKVILYKNRTSDSTDWGMYHTGLASNNAYMSINTTNALSGSTNRFNNTAPTSSVYTINTHATINESSSNFIAYCFAEKKGYSKFSSYTGNGNADGVFIYTGFRPAWILIKKTSGTQDWQLMDTKRDSFNLASRRIEPNNSDAENNDTSYNNMDILSNGFKFRATGGNTNDDGGTYIYMAFAEAPFVNSNGVPCNAR